MSLSKYDQFVLDLASGVHQLQTGTTHVLKVALTNTAPNASTHAVLSDINEIAGGGGYPSGGLSIGTIAGSETSGTFKLTGSNDPSFVATTGFGPFRYVVLYNSTPSSPASPLIGWWDYGSSVTLSALEQFVVDINQINGILTIQ